MRTGKNRLQILFQCFIAICCCVKNHTFLGKAWPEKRWKRITEHRRSVLQAAVGEPWGKVQLPWGQVFGLGFGVKLARPNCLPLVPDFYFTSFLPFFLFIHMFYTSLGVSIHKWHVESSNNSKEQRKNSKQMYCFSDV